MTTPPVASLPLQLPRQMSGGTALAYGAALAGVGCVTGYPGSPSTATMTCLLELAAPAAAAADAHCHLEWSANERVALEVAIGAALGGRRALVCTKSVGMNVLIDPLMALNLTPLGSGLVILLGDDPGAYGSQNDQDSRALADLAEVPLVEPTSVEQGLLLMRDAFAASERSGLPVIVRVTRSFDVAVAEVTAPAGSHRWQVVRGEARREPFRFVPYPGNAVAKHHQLHERLAACSGWVADSSYNSTRMVGGAGGAAAGAAAGIVAAGFCAEKLRDVLAGVQSPAELAVLELAGLHPLPEQPLRQLLAAHRRVLVLEENEPYLEQRIHGLAHQAGLQLAVHGKLTGDVARCGELYRWQIAAALQRFAPQLQLATGYRAEDEAAERPARKDHCAGCPFDLLVDAVERWLQRNGRDPWLIADPGCLATQAPRLAAKYAMGSAVAVASGLRHVGQDAVAMFGDSSFFHAALPALCNAAVRGVDLACIVADNDGAVTTGRQPHPGSDRDQQGSPRAGLDMLAIARACGAAHAERAQLADLEQALPRALDGGGVRLLVVELSCS